MAASLDDRRRNRRAALWLFVGLSSFYVLGNGGTVDAPDGAVMFRLSQSLVERGSFAIEPLPSYPSFGGRWVQDPATGQQRFYPKYGPALSVAAIPGYLAGSVLSPLATREERGIFEPRVHPELSTPETPREFAFPLVRQLRALWYDASRANFPEAMKAFGANLTNSFVAAGTATLLFLLGLRLGWSRGRSVGLALLGGLATPLWPYSKTFFSEPLAALGLAGCLFSARKGFDTGRLAAWWLLSGLALGLTVLAKPVHAVLALPAGLLLICYGWRCLRRVPRVLPFRGLLAWALGLGICAGLFGLYDLYRFGSVLETGYGGEAVRFTGSFRDGFLGLLASPGRGLFVYCPLALLSVAGARRFARRNLPEALFVFGCLATLLCLYAFWYEWDGGWCWGPRFLLPAVPLLVLPAAEVVLALPARLPARLAVLVTTSLSAAVAFSGTLVHFIDYGHWLKLTWVFHRKEFLRQGITAFLPVARWDPLYAPVLRYWGFPVKDYYLLPLSLENPGIVTALFALAFGLSVIAAARLYFIAREPA